MRYKIYIVILFLLIIINPIKIKSNIENKHYLSDEYYIIEDPITKWMLDNNKTNISKDDLLLMPPNLRAIIEKPSVKRTTDFKYYSYSTIYDDNNEYIVTIAIIYNKNDEEMYCLDSHLDAPGSNQYNILNDTSKQAMWQLINYGKKNNVSYGNIQFALWYYFNSSIYVNKLGFFNISTDTNQVIRNVLNESKIEPGKINIHIDNKHASYDDSLKENIIRNIKIDGFKGNYSLSINNPDIKVYLSNSNTLLDHNMIKSGTSIDLRINPFIDINNLKINIRVLDDMILSGELWNSSTATQQNLASIPKQVPFPLASFYISAKNATGSLKLIKHQHIIDESNTIEIAGVEFKLYYDKQLQYEVNNSLKPTNDKGEIIWDNLLPGVYYTKEYKTNNNHIIISDKIYPTTVISNQTTLIDNQIIVNDVKGGFMLQKVYQEHDTTSLLPIKDVVFAYKPLLSKDKPIFVSSDDNGMVIVSSLDTGFYLVWEHQSNHENLIIDSTPKVIEIKPNLTTKLDLKNNSSHINQQLGKLVIEKGVHKLDSSDIHLEQGVSFQLKSVAKRENDIITSYFDTLTTNQNGQVSYVNLPASSSKLKYYYHEVDAINDQVIIDDSWYEVVIKDSEVTYLTDKNKVINDVKGRFMLTKHRRMDNMDTMPLENVVYTLYNDDSLTEVVSVYKSDNNGLIISDGLDSGNYYLKETNNNIKELYLDENIYKIKIENNKTTYVNEDKPIINEFIKSEVEIIKLDQYYQPLSDAVLVLYDNDGNIIKEWKSTNNSEIIKLRYGKYYVKEKVAPNGYVVSDNHYQINVTKHNDKIKIKIVNFHKDIIKSGLRIDIVNNFFGIIISILLLTNHIKKGRYFNVKK